MIQLNLIPELKAEFLKAQRTRNTVVSISFLVSGGFIALTVLMFLHVNVNQRNHSNNLQEHITELTEEYSAIEDLDKVITIQKQLESLPNLHNSKPLVSRLPKYLTILTPEQVELSDFEMSFEDERIIITGTADDVPAVNIYADTIKNAIYTITVEHDLDEDVSRGDTIETDEWTGTAQQDGESGDTIKVSVEKKPFSNVILDNITSDDDGATYEIIMTFDPEIFTNHDEVVMSVPEIESTLSERESPKVGDETRENQLFDTEEDQ